MRGLHAFERTSGGRCRLYGANPALWKGAAVKESMIPVRVLKGILEQRGTFLVEVVVLLLLQLPRLPVFCTFVLRGVVPKLRILTQSPYMCSKACRRCKPSFILVYTFRDTVCTIGATIATAATGLPALRLALPLSAVALDPSIIS